MGRSGAEGDSELWSILYLASPRGHLSKVIDIVGVYIKNLSECSTGHSRGFTQIILSAGSV